MIEKSKIEKIKNILLWVIVMYILNKGLCDWATLGVSKIVYYSVIAASAMFGMINLFFKKSTRVIVILFGAYALISLINGVCLSNWEQFRVGVIQYITYPLPFFALSYLMGEKKDFSKLLYGIVIWGAVTSLLAMYEYFSLQSILPGFEEIYYKYQNGTVVYRATVYIGSPLFLGVLLGAALIVASFLFYRKRKWWILATTPLIFAGILCTGSRGPLLCSVGGIVVMFGTIAIQNGISKRLRKIMGIVGVTAAVCVVILFAVPNLSTGNEQIDFFIYRFTSAFDFKTEWGNLERLKRWTYYLGLFMEQPMFGYGLASTSAMVKSNQMVTSHGITTESGILGRLVESGIVGTLAYYLFLSACIWKGFKGICKRENRRTETRYMVIGIIALLLVEDIILQVSLDIFCNFLMWFVLAYALNQTMDGKEKFIQHPIIDGIKKIGL